MAIEWHYINDYLAIGVDWCADVGDTSVSLAPKVYRWDKYDTDNYGGRYSETLSPDPVGAGYWSGYGWGSGSGTRHLDTFGTRTYGRNSAKRTVSLKISWTNTGTAYNYAFHSVADGSHTWTYTIDPIDYENPHDPTDVAAVRESDSKNTVSWKHSCTDYGDLYPVEGFIVERKTDGGSWSQVAKVANWEARSYSDTTTSANHFYEYRVTAYCGDRKSSAVAAGQVLCNTPCAPKGITASRLAETTVSIAIENDAVTAQGLTLQRSTDGESWETVAELSGSPVTSATDEPGGGTFYYRARNTRDSDDGGVLRSEWSAASNAVVTICAPNAPTLKSPASGVVIPKSQANVTFQWAHNPIDGSKQTAAQLACSTDGGSTWTTVSVTTAQSKTLANSFAVNSTVTWRVRTKGAHADWGPWSSNRVLYVYQQPSVSFEKPADGFTVENTPIHVALQYGDPSGTLASATLSVYDGANKVYSRNMGTSTECDILASEWLPENGKAYTLSVSVRSTSTLTASAVRDISVDFTLPTPATLGIANDPETGYVSLLVDVPSRFSHASGSPVRVTDALGGAQVERLSVYGNSHQVVTEGRNLLPYPYGFEEGGLNGITWKKKDGKVTASGTLSGSSSYKPLSSWSSNAMSLPAGTYAFSTGSKINMTVGVYTSDDGSTYETIAGPSTSGTFTLEEESLMRVYLTTVRTEKLNETVYPMICLASDADDTWEPYSGGMASPSPDWPQPITTLGARNVLPYPFFSGSKEASGITWTNNGDGSVTVDGTATANSSFYYHPEGAPFSLPTGKYVLSGCPGVGSNKTYRMSLYKNGAWFAQDIGKGVAFEVEETDALYLISIVYNGTTVSNLTFKPMIRPAACEDDEWVPYGKVKVESRGKNLCKPKEYTAEGVTGTVADDGAIVLNGTAAKTGYLILQGGFAHAKKPITESPFKVGKTYVASGVAGSAEVRLYAYDEDGTAHYCVSSIQGMRTLTIPETAAYYGVFVAFMAGATFGNAKLYAQIEEGETATDFVPYHAPLTALIDMQGEEVRALPDGTRDALEVDGAGNVTLVKRVGKVVLDGSETWIASSTVNNNGGAGFYATLKNSEVFTASADNRSLCDKLTYSHLGMASMPVNSYKVSRSSIETGLVYICVDFAATVDELTAWLAANPMTVYYPLATPETIALGAVELSDLPAPDFTLDAEASLPAALDLTYTNGMEEASSVSVWRETEDGRVLLGDGLQAGSAVVDRYAPLNTEYRYIASTFADSGAANSQSFGNRLDTLWAFLYFYGGLARCKWNPNRTHNIEPSVEYVHYVGNTYPTAHMDDFISETCPVTAFVIGREEARAFRNMVMSREPIVAKLWRGDVFWAVPKLSENPRTGNVDWYEVSVDLTRIEGDAL